MEENYNEQNYNSENSSQQRPSMLTVLCVLTFIGSGMSLLSYSLMPSMMPLFESMLANGGTDENMMLMREVYEPLFQLENWYFYVISAMNALSFIGAIYMFQMKKIGFHFYVVAQILLLALAYWQTPEMQSISSYLSTMIFIILYGMQFKYLTK